MSLIRIKDNVPQPYVSESRDFQLFTRVLDFVQNSLKFDIDTMTNVVDTDLISDAYLDRLKSKLGFFTTNVYDDRTLRIVLSAFPYIIKYKGSEEGIKRCVNTYLNIAGVSGGCRIDVYNNDDDYPYTVRVGIGGTLTVTNVLKDMLSYVMPSGYGLDIYSYTPISAPAEVVQLDSKASHAEPTGQHGFSTVSGDAVNHNKVHLSTVYDTDGLRRNN
jgi:hypothetical protein